MTFHDRVLQCLHRAVTKRRGQVSRQHLTTVDKYLRVGQYTRFTRDIAFHLDRVELILTLQSMR